jgi:MFS superfamily sulfate permease-like transporter
VLYDSREYSLTIYGHIYNIYIAVFIFTGFLVDFISAPVLEGFLSAAAILAISGQIAPLLGLPSGGSDFIGYWVNIIRNIQHGIGEWDLVLGVACIVTLYTFQV